MYHWPLPICVTIYDHRRVTLLKCSPVFLFNRVLNATWTPVSFFCLKWVYRFAWRRKASAGIVIASRSKSSWTIIFDIAHIGENTFEIEFDCGTRFNNPLQRHGSHGNDAWQICAANMAVIWLQLRLANLWGTLKNQIREAAEWSERHRN